MPSGCPRERWFLNWRSDRWPEHCKTIAVGEKPTALVLSSSADAFHQNPLCNRHLPEQLSAFSGGANSGQATASAAWRFGGGLDNVSGLLSNGPAVGIPGCSRAYHAPVNARASDRIFRFAGPLPGA